MRIFSPKKCFIFLFSFCFSFLMHAQKIAINEIMSSNTTSILDEDATHQDWIELYNYGTVNVNLNGFGLSDDPLLPYKWRFPNVTLNANSYMIIWASDKNRIVVGQPYHTNFKLSATDALQLTNPAGVLLNTVPATVLPQNVSLGRQPDGTGEFMFFYQPTPNSSNIGTGLTELIAPPLFSQDSGVFSTPFDLTITSPNPNAVIVYTLDGSEPNINNLSGTSFKYKNVYPIEVFGAPGPFLTETYKSFQYSNPINIYDRSSLPDKLTNKNSRQDPIYIPPTPVRKGTVLKAKCYVNGVGSNTVSKSYFVWSSGNPYNIPIISLQTQEDNLFDYDKGTYTSGVDFDTWRKNNPDNNQFYRPEWNNYGRIGSLWEHPVNVEILNNSVSVLNQKAGYRIHGDNSRTFVIKSLRLYADTDYEERGDFTQTLFNSPIFDAPNLSNNKFKQILLRGDGSGGSVANDVVFHRLMQPVFNGVNRVQPVIHFINGEYWGISAMRDLMDEHHYANNFDLDKDNIAIVKCAGSNCDIDVGTEIDYFDYNSLKDYILNNDMANEAFYAQASSRLDMTTFIDHMVLQIYSGANGYERSFWKARTKENSSYGDGKWRVSVKDFDSALKTNEDWLAHWGTIVNSPNEIMFTKLLANSSFKNSFINRFADLINSVFSSNNFLAVTNTVFNEVEPYLDENSNRNPAKNFYTTTDKQNLITYGSSHPVEQRNSIRTFFNIPNNVNIILGVSDSSAGIVKINTIDVSNATPGIVENPYPWTGIYFKNIPITLTAKAKKGYIFSHWSGDVTGTSPEITFTPDGDRNIQANFVVDPSSLNVVYFWHFTGAIPNNLPLQNLNSTYSNNNSTATLQYSSCLVGYPFTATDLNWRLASFERRNAPTPLNYFSVANNGLPYDSGVMRGIQIKQPFKSGNLENILRIVFPTLGLQQIKISFAVESDGAANTLIFDYWDGINWVNTGISNPSVSIGVGYSLVEVNLNQVAVANNQAGFQFRIRFAGDNMFQNLGLRVQFNNIAIQAQQNLSVKNVTNDFSFIAYPNPTFSAVNIQSNDAITEVEVFNLNGQIVRKLMPNSLNFNFDMQDLPQGIYLLKAKSESKKGKVIKISKK